jgi:hypothetical protein
VYQLAGYTAVQELHTEVFPTGRGKKIADVRGNIFRFATIRGGVVCDIALNWLKQWRVGAPA